MNIRRLIEREQLWYKKAYLISMYHTIHTMMHKQWTIKDSARELDLSVGFICENLQLIETIREDKSLMQLSRNAALKVMRQSKI